MNSFKRFFYLVLVSLTLSNTACDCFKNQWVKFMQRVDSVVIADVDGLPITQTEWEGQIRNYPLSIISQFNTPQGRSRLLDTLIQRKVVLALALKENIQNDPKIVSQIESSRQSILAQAYVNKLHANLPLTEISIQEYYKQHRDRFIPLNQFSWNGIRFRSNATAEKAAKLLSGGRTFEEVALQYASDKKHPIEVLANTKMLEPSISAILEALHPGQTSPLLKTKNGLEIFRRITPSPEPLPNVRNQIIRMIQDEDLRKKIEAAKQTMKIQINEEILKSLPISETMDLNTSTREANIPPTK